MKHKPISSVDNQFKKAEAGLSKVGHGFDSRINPLRQALGKRYPGLFALVGTFGLVVTFYGFEQFIAQFETVNNNPLLILFIGLATLYLTGRAFKDFKPKD